MRDNYTRNAHEAIRLAKSASRHNKQNYTGTEHLLLGLLRLDDCGAVRALKAAGVDLNNVCTAIMDVFGNPDPRGRPQGLRELAGPESRHGQLAR